MHHLRPDHRPRRAAPQGPFRRRAVALALATAVLASACSSGAEAGGRDAGTTEAGPSSTTAAPTGDPAIYPGAEWAEADPAASGLDPAAFDRLAAQAEAADSSCLVVTRHGAVVDERYWQGSDAESAQEAFSVTKSITSTLVGIAQDEGDLALDDSASRYIPSWAGTPAEAVTVEDLLSNDSGREWSLSLDYGQMVNATDQTAFAVGLGQPRPPGQEWVYNNSAIQTLDEVLTTATGQEPQDYARARLFDRIGMDRSEMTTDAAGNTRTFMGLQTTCLDLARFGYLMLRGGEWDGEQVVSRQYVEAATGRSSTELNAAYGYLWWLNRRGQLADPDVATTGAPDGARPDDQMVPGVPDDVFWALGLFDQIVAVIPSEGIVATRMGGPPDPETPFSQTELTEGLLEAVTDR
ncbi:MAG TPA: serine hydrolase [Acidimicrobiales bacterium]|nr:serine hydrolase [Acidimicrobiales bacterium]